jgi:hypothetical protein
MKTHSQTASLAIFSVTIAILAIFITRPAYSQDPVKKSSHKKVIVKIATDDNGARTVIDTTFEIPDSLAIDSLRKEIDRLIRIGKDAQEHCFWFHGMPDNFSFDFDIPYMDEALKEFEVQDLPEWGEVAPDRENCEKIIHNIPLMPERSAFGPRGEGQTLSDVIGNIPMDRVTSYSIKDRKNGKRIIIDLSDAPVIERQSKVIVIRDPTGFRYNSKHPGHRVKIYKKQVSPEDPPAASQPEEPTTPARPEKSSDKPKI